MSNFKRVPLTGTICSFSAKEENDLIFQNFDQIKVARVALYIGQYTIFTWRITCAYSPFSTKLLNSMLLCAHNTPKIHIKLCILFIQILSQLYIFFLILLNFAIHSRKSQFRNMPRLIGDNVTHPVLEIRVYKEAKRRLIFFFAFILTNKIKQS